VNGVNLTLFHGPTEIEALATLTIQGETTLRTRQDQRKRNLIEITARVPRLLPPSFKKQARGRHQGISFPSEQDFLQHHIIAKDTKKFINSSTWLNDLERVQGPAYRVSLIRPFYCCILTKVVVQKFRKNLQGHLVSRIEKEKPDEDFPEFRIGESRISQWSPLPHVRTRVLYTTYDPVLVRLR
jgi:hypothetical protein